MRPSLLAAAAIISIGCVHTEASPIAPTAGVAVACAPSVPSSATFALAVLGSGGPVSSGRAASDCLRIDVAK